MSRVATAFAYFATLFLGASLALGLYQAWQLETRWTAVVFMAIAAVAVSMCLVRIFSDFLLILLLFCLPLTPFTKWFSPFGFSEGTHGLVTFGILGLNLTDFILVGLYMSWFYRVFVVRERGIPRLYLLDGLLFWYILANLLSTIGSYSPATGLESIEYLVKNMSIYFYLSRHLQERHIPWLLAAFAATVLIDGLLGSYQFATGKLTALALNKFAGSSGVDLNWQYAVPGTSKYTRATGLSYDSHELAELIGGMLPFALVLLLTPRLRPLLKLGCFTAAGIASLTIILTLSRTGWIASAVGLATGIVLIIFMWQERQIIPMLAGVIVLTALMLPVAGPFIYDRFLNSPVSTITDRFDMFAVAWYIFTLHPLFGVGPGNYIHAFHAYDYIGMLRRDPNSLQLVEIDLPVHNSLLWQATEIGAFGLLAYVSIVINGSWRLFSLARARRDIPARLALAALLGLVTFMVGDQFIPVYRTPDVFMLFWILMALSIALPRMRPGAGALLMVPELAAGPAVPGLPAGQPAEADGG